MPEQDITLINITELPPGTATLDHPIIFGIGELLHTTTLENIKTLILTGVITEIPPNKIKIVNVFPHGTFDDDWAIDQLFAVAQAINYTLSTFYGGEIVNAPGERIVFRLIQSSYFEPEPGLLIPNVLWRYYSETSGALLFTGISDPAGDLVPNGVIRNIPDNLVNLGDIGMTAIETAFNADPEAPFTMDANSFILAIQGDEPKIWKWIGGDGLYGGVATAAVSGDFFLLNQAPVAPLDYLPTKTITDNPYTLTPDDLNRPLIFTSNDQVVNVGTTLAELAANAGLTLFDFKANFTGTGTHTVNYPDSETQDFAQNALIYALCIDITGDSLWVVKEIGGGGTGDMSKATYDPNNVESDAFATDNMVEPTTAKTTPVDADTMTLWDSVASFVSKKVTWANIKTTLEDYFDTLYGTIAQAKYEVLMFAVSDEETLLTTGTGKITFRMPYAMTLSSVRASVVTAPTGANLIVDINESGTTILSTKLSIDATEKTSTTATTPPVISDSALADDAEITIDIDQIGSTIAGAGLKVTLIGTRT